MRKGKKRIVIFDGSYKTTPFINRLVKGLILSNEVFILGFNEQNTNAITGARYLPLGDNQNTIRFLWISIGLALKSMKFSIVSETLKDLRKGNRKKIQKRNLNLQLSAIKPDIVHLQWPSLISWSEELLKEGKYNFILSQRGYHINVRPFVDTDNFNYLREFYPFFKGFHSVSKAISDRGNLIFSSESKIDQVVHSGYELSEFKFEKNRVQNKKLEILSVGRPHWIKGYIYAMRACKLLKDEGVDFRYCIIGGERNEELLYLIHVYGLDDKVLLETQIPQDEVYKRMRASDVLLLPSIEEGIANVAIEAMLLGTPVISADCGGMAELIENDKSGWLVPVRDADAIFHSLSKLERINSMSLEKIRTEAYDKVVNQFSDKKMLIQMNSLYQEVLEK